MNSIELTAQLQTLDTYNQMRAAEANMNKARKAVPVHINTSSRQDLIDQLHYLDTKVAQVDAIRGLQVDVAEKADRLLLPLAYSLGVMAAYDVLADKLTPIPDSRVLVHRGRNLSDFTNAYRSMQPIERATKIGDVLTTVGEVLASDGSLPVAMIWNKELSRRTTLSTIVAGKTSSSWALQYPKIIRGKVSYHLPIGLNGVTEIEVIRQDTENGYPTEAYTDPTIPELAKLTRQVKYNTPTELLLGDAALARIQNVRADIAYNAIHGSPKLKHRIRR